MKRTIRLMTWLAVASATPVAFAESGDAATTEKDASEQQAVLPTRAETMGTADEDAGGGRGELPGQKSERHARADARTAEQRAQELQKMKEYSERKALEEIWTRP